MTILEKAAESTRRTAIINGVTIYWQKAQELIPIVLSEPKNTPEEFQYLCLQLQGLCEKVEEGIKEVKSLIPPLNSGK